MSGPRLGTFEPLASLVPPGLTLFPSSFLLSHCPASPLFQGVAVRQQRKRGAYPFPCCAEMASGTLSVALIK